MQLSALLTLCGDFLIEISENLSGRLVYQFLYIFFSLSVLSTDLSGEQETEVRTFIAQRLARGTIYSGSGHLATLDTIVPNESHMCYYCVLRGGREE